jgi:hypothetical protein
MIKYVGKTIAEKPDKFAELNKKVRRKTEIAQAYGIPLSTLSTYLKNRDSIENQVLQGAEVSKRKRIRGAKHTDLVDELFEWFCHGRANNIPVEGQQSSTKDGSRISVFESLASVIQAATEHHMASH